MALHDYRTIDGDDYYGQGFGDRAGKVSVWIGMTDYSEAPKGLDVLQDLCGVGYYDVDDQESNCLEFQVTPLRRLLQDISYSASFIDAAEEAAHEKHATDGRWVFVQFDFAYDPTKVKRKPAPDPMFLGVFDYATDE